MDSKRFGYEKFLWDSKYLFFLFFNNASNYLLGVARSHIVLVQIICCFDNDTYSDAYA